MSSPKTQKQIKILLILLVVLVAFFQFGGIALLTQNSLITDGIPNPSNFVTLSSLNALYSPTNTGLIGGACILHPVGGCDHNNVTNQTICWDGISYSCIDGICLLSYGGGNSCITNSTCAVKKNNSEGQDYCTQQTNTTISHPPPSPLISDENQVYQLCAGTVFSQITSDEAKPRALSCFTNQLYTLPGSATQTVNANCYLSDSNLFQGKISIAANKVQYCSKKFDFFAFLLTNWTWLIVAAITLLFILLGISARSQTIDQFIRDNWDGFLIGAILFTLAVATITQGSAFDTTLHTSSEILKAVGGFAAIGAAIGVAADMVAGRG